MGTAPDSNLIGLLTLTVHGNGPVSEREARYKEGPLVIIPIKNDTVAEN